MKKALSAALSALMLIALIAGCADNGGANTTEDTPATVNQEQNGASSVTGQPIYILSREEGSGTRSAFVELFGIEEKDENGDKVDRTVESAEITSSTGVMMTTVAGNKYAIGYISLGSLDGSVTALKVDGVEASIDSVKNGTYKASRPFNIAAKESLSEAAQDFVDFILSADGQKIVEDNGYVSTGNTGAFTGGTAAGKVKVAGSSSVTPVMEKLAEAYQALNSGVEISIQQSDSSTGITSAAEGICDIGMASRELKDSEREKGLVSTTIAMDGIAVIVNNESGVTEITSEEIKEIYTGQRTLW